MYWTCAFQTVPKLPAPSFSRRVYATAGFASFSACFGGDGMLEWSRRGMRLCYIDSRATNKNYDTRRDTFPTRYRAPRKADAGFVYANDTDNRLPPPPPSTEPDTPHDSFMSTSLFSMFSACFYSPTCIPSHCRPSHKNYEGVHLRRQAVRLILFSSVQHRSDLPP